MADIHALEGLSYWNGLLSNNETPNNIEYKIYTNPITLTNTLSTGDLVELVHPDYSPYTTLPGDWDFTSVAGQLSHPEYQWRLNTGGVSIVGIYMTIDGKLFYATELDEYVSSGIPVPVNAAGAVIRFTYSQQISGAQ